MEWLQRKDEKIDDPWHPKRGETLAEYFARLNEDLIGTVSVFELPEEGGELVCIRAASSEAVPLAPSPERTAAAHPLITAVAVSKPLTSDDLSGMRLGRFRLQNLASSGMNLLNTGLRHGGCWNDKIEAGTILQERLQIRDYCHGLPGWIFQAFISI